jgi:hypothetical protein
MLSWNAGKVRNLTGAEIWLFIVARVFIGFGLGALVVRYWPRTFFPIAVPVLIVGVILFLIAAKGLGRRSSN